MSDVAIAVENVGVALGSTQIVAGASFSLRKGKLTALVGPNGAGKTTLMRALAGLIPAQGLIAADGRAISDLPARERARLIGYLPQGNIFHWPMPVEAIIGLGRYPYGDPFSAATKDDGAAVKEAMIATATEEFAARPVTNLSGGERARVALARALATQSPILLVDEPTVSLDARHQLAVMDLLRAAAKRGAAVLAIVHDLTLVARFADRVLMMQNGRVVADGETRAVLVPERIADVFGVETAMIDLDGAQLPIPRRPL